MQKINLEIIDQQEIVTTQKLQSMEGQLQNAHDILLQKNGAGSDFLGWVDLPDTDEELIKAIEVSAAEIREQADVLVVIGIGGSHLGGQAGIEFIKGVKYNNLHGENPEVYFVGHDLSVDSWQQTAKMLQGKQWCINVISKSGATLEPALAFGFFESLLIDKYGAEEANRRIYATTDAQNGLLHDQAEINGWTRFVIPDDVGGRYSALTPVGLLPWMVAGVNMREVLAGAREMKEQLLNDQSWQNPAWQYAAVRYLYVQSGKMIETMATYEPRLTNLTKWWQQLFGESEGKTERVLFPVSIELTRDLHSLGQWLQQGPRNIVETTLWLDNPPVDQAIVLDAASSEAMPFTLDKTVGLANEQAFRATVAAHAAGGVPNLVLTLERADEQNLGGVLFFFEYACAISSYLLGVNPFDQPGVQAYKDEMMNRLKA